MHSPFLTQIKAISFLFISCLLLPFAVWAQENDDIFSEDDIFSDSQQIQHTEEDASSDVTKAITEQSLSFSGNIEAKGNMYISRDTFDGSEDFGDNAFASTVNGDFLLDVRLPKGVRAFGDLWAGYTLPMDDDETTDDEFDTLLKEAFADANIRQKAYFRAGKQNLKWGQGYLWNPTDLISVDRKNFENINDRREGAYGLKTHVPFGSDLNFYTFVNANNADTLQELAVAGKIEFVMLNNVEVSFSAWDKDDYVPVFGMDVTTYRLGTHWRGEMSLSKGENSHRLEEQNGEYVDAHETEDVTYRLTLGCTRLFDVGNFNDRLSVTGEFYYNGAGYDDDMLGNDAVRDQFLQGGYFQPNNYGKYYAAAFTTFGRFLLPDMTLNVNAIGNFSDSSGQLSVGVDYLLTFNATLSAKLETYLGAENREYTLDGNALNAEIKLNVVF